jgi:type I restriction enzyme S subunit
MLGLKLRWGMSKTSIPDGWLMAEFSDVIKRMSNGVGGKQSKDGIGLPVSRIETIADETFDFGRIGFIADYDSEKVEKYKLNAGDILFSHINSPAHLGKTAIFKSGNDLYHGINLLRIEVEDEIVSELFNQFCRYTRGTGEFSLRAQHAVNQSSINQKKLGAFEFPLPPIAEQREIARRLDELLAQVDTLKTRLDAIPAILKRFRQSTLAAATSGKLTEQWRDTNSSDVECEVKLIQSRRDDDFHNAARAEIERSGKKIRKPDYSCDVDTVPNRNMPNEWRLTQIGEIISLLTDYHANGSYKVLKQHVELKEEPDYACMIRATNFEKNNFDDLMIYISEDAYNFMRKSKLFGGEILIGKIGNAGCVYHMPHLNRPASLAMNLFALRFYDELVSSKYIYMFLKSSAGDANIQQYVRGVATKSIDKKSVRSVYINLPSFKEQTEIVRRVEELFAFADQVEQRVNDAQARVNHLTQSILAKAFRGELTSEWRTNNPELISGENSAAALLKRIKTEREKQTPKKKTRKKK